MCEIVTIKKESHKIFKENLVLEMSMSMWLICVQFCSRTKICKSVNFITQNKPCQINGNEPANFANELLESAGNCFVASSSISKSLAGICKGHYCNINEVCIPTSQSYLCLPLFGLTSGNDKLIHPRDCSDIPLQYPSGVYRIYSNPSTDFSVYCDMETAGGGWTVFQRWENGSVDFYRNWTTYETGFGDLNHEFWLGNKNIASITVNGRYRLLVQLKDFEGNSRYVQYNTFTVGDSMSGYVLKISGFSGNTGDSLSYQNGMKFTTYDRANDKLSTNNCATKYKGAWWFGSCHISHLNGAYLKGPHSSNARGIVWKHWKGFYYSLKSTRMMIQRY
ncbi:Fibrinogen-like protein A,Ryncolin-4,Angiopoietin-related protein 7,Ficolin-3,Ficolin-1-B,Techylectin-5A,Ficolin-2,Ryncolin-1,Tenascin-R,Fibrinogen-like protein 1,Angiopoietin-related protein 4,Angiopoietin-1,Fibrinogen C domain-containing protein 1-A,Ryncolin-3,Tenascin,Techylectin-like protein,Fibrinogen C domain-containing protein 1,Ryncolin-2,Techylectin-5B,Angiopoietin-related protein 2,Angiopoietin-2,Microfibril-associated glycoprotein 4,Ficolin-1-A,Ficolin-1,Fibrinogen C domain-containing protein 1-|uniref:Fibrinogen C-terminal domain-containing protein n=1 Tax=Mytilus coruscus TaxID=42192 RepID=A0A6J8BXZ3_MYTCO|nr:Fibrinogen-like protein A,Ryncolin-4,Angiopoietin-related protein 7,Ficolin-3,Ficolin-1-B,Techylectin-5A,Ficolin-2,Ryncolin-1,Tenascin-R,Fibrinogen-like protein 1,Angiopoietin-related protein 4,Angiopoietin-1,Fibrinogen C domain-containing protein 1-A,Ryncolin-3,Tenascin,Techylectin-like protein,Fibrinogen C domain-containing protein 1,Ryncolin-2,Techylectin-5B,Angiopoietin-related protein 2,Angiopoietin-2,Microfibril-associated glycoprotein 4,Ficolin-1-A,Ficolin-1,Fibrinogen C domain-containing